MQTTKCHVSSWIKHGTIRRHKGGGGKKKLHPAYQITCNLLHNFSNQYIQQGNEMKAILENCLEVLFHHLILHH